MSVLESSTVAGRLPQSPAKPLSSMPKQLRAALVISAMVCLALAALTYGTNDVLFFKSYVAKAMHDGPAELYRHGARLVAYHPEVVEPMAHPPAMLTLWKAVQYAESSSGIPFHFWFRLLTVVANLISAVLVWKLGSAKAAIYYALCPAAMMIAGFHGNSDPLVVALLLGSVYAAECKDRSAWSGALYGMAISIKVWPLFLLLAFLLGFKTWRARLVFVALAVVAVAALAFPYILSDPWLIFSKVFGYRSDSGRWGLSLFPSYVRIGAPFTFAAIAVAVAYLRQRNASLSHMVGSSILLFLVLTPGFGVQYLAWILPFCFVFGEQVTIGVYATTSAFLFVTYTFWSGGIPWYFADSIAHQAGTPIVFYFGVLTWNTLAASAVMTMRARGIALSKSSAARPLPA